MGLLWFFYTLSHLTPRSKTAWHNPTWANVINAKAGTSDPASHQSGTHRDFPPLVGPSQAQVRLIELPR